MPGSHQQYPLSYPVPVGGGSFDLQLWQYQQQQQLLHLHQQSAMGRAFAPPPGGIPGGWRERISGMGYPCPPHMAGMPSETPAMHPGHRSRRSSSIIQGLFDQPLPSPAMTVTNPAAVPTPPTLLPGAILGSPVPAMSLSPAERSPESGKPQQQKHVMYGSLMRQANRATGGQRRLSSPLIRHSDSGGGGVDGAAGVGTQELGTVDSNASVIDASRLLSAGRRRTGSDMSAATTVRMDSSMSLALHRVSESEGEDDSLRGKKNGKDDGDDNDDRDSGFGDVSPLRERGQAS